MLNLMYKITNQASRNPIKILLQKKIGDKGRRTGFLYFVSFSSEEKNAGVVSDRGHNDGGAEEKAVKEIAMVRSRITVQVIQQYSDSRGFKMPSLGGVEGKHFKAHHILNRLCTYECVCESDI